jgi:hypothetical protein
MQKLGPHVIRAQKSEFYGEEGVDHGTIISQKTSFFSFSWLHAPLSAANIYPCQTRIRKTESERCKEVAFVAVFVGGKRGRSQF